MTRIAKGTFAVEMTAQGAPSVVDGVSTTRLSLAKRFDGDFQGAGEGEMLAVRTPVAGSAGYVAVERVTGTLDGCDGSFVLQHSGTMDRDAHALAIAVVPDSGTGGLTGITGTFKIDIVDGKHSYAFSYSLP